MPDPGRQRAHARQPICVRETCMQSFALADIADDDTACGSAIGILCGNGSQVSPEVRAIVAVHAQLALLGLSHRKELFAMPVVNVLVFTHDEAGEGLLGERASRHAQEGGDGEVCLRDQSALVEGQVAHGCQVVEIEILRTLDVQLCLRATQLLILHLEFDLINLELANDTLLRFQRELLAFLRRTALALSSSDFGTLP